MFENYTDCLFNDKIILKSQQRFKSDDPKVCTVFKVCESEMLTVKDLFLKNYNEI